MKEGGGLKLPFNYWKNNAFGSLECPPLSTILDVSTQHITKLLSIMNIIINFMYSLIIYTIRLCFDPGK